MRKVWCVATGKFNGKDGKDYFENWAQSFDMYDDMLKRCKTLCIVDIRPCETKKEAQSIAETWNRIYQENGTLAYADLVENKVAWN